MAKKNNNKDNEGPTPKDIFNYLLGNGFVGLAVPYYMGENYSGPYSKELAEKAYDRGMLTGAVAPGFTALLLERMKEGKLNWKDAGKIAQEIVGSSLEKLTVGEFEEVMQIQPRENYERSYSPDTKIGTLDEEVRQKLVGSLVEQEYHRTGVMEASTPIYEAFYKPKESGEESSESE